MGNCEGRSSSISNNGSPKEADKKKEKHLGARLIVRIWSNKRNDLFNYKVGGYRESEYDLDAQEDLPKQLQPLFGNFNGKMVFNPASANQQLQKWLRIGGEKQEIHKGDVFKMGNTSLSLLELVLPKAVEQISQVTEQENQSVAVPHSPKRENLQNVCSSFSKTNSNLSEKLCKKEMCQDCQHKDRLYACKGKIATRSWGLLKDYTTIQSSKQGCEEHSEESNDGNEEQQGHRTLRESMGSCKVMRQCRICLEEEEEQWMEEVEGVNNINRLVSVCGCQGSMKYVHLQCLDRWMRSKQTSKEVFNSRCCDFISNKSLICELCRNKYPIRLLVGQTERMLFEKEANSESFAVFEINNAQSEALNGILVLNFNHLQSNFSLGRGNLCDLRLNDLTVSRFHAELSIDFESQKLFLKDIPDSKFGTLLKINSFIPIDSSFNARQIQINNLSLEFRVPSLQETNVAFKPPSSVTPFCSFSYSCCMPSQSQVGINEISLGNHAN